MISVIMSVFNGEEFIGETINSVLNQSYKNFEFIITDDFSSDNTINVIRSFDDSRIILLENSSQMGLTKNLNNMLDIAKGEYIARIDSDDICKTERFMIQKKYLDSHSNIDVVGSFIEAFGNKEGIIKAPTKHEDIKCFLLFYCCIYHPTIMFRNNKEIYYDDTFLKAQDYELWTRIIVDKKFANIKRPLVNYRYHENQVSYAGKSNQNYYSDKIKVRQLYNLGISLCDKDEDIYINYLTNGFVQTEVEAEIIDKIFDRIYYSNVEKKMYSKKSIAKIINSKRFSIVQNLKNLDLEYNIVQKKIPYRFRMKMTFFNKLNVWKII